MRNTRNWKNCTNWNKIKKLHYSYNFWYFFYIDFSIINHYLFTSEQRSPPLIIHNYTTEVKRFPSSLPQWSRWDLVHRFGGPWCLQQSPLLTAYTGLDTFICPHNEGLFFTHYYEQARSVIWIGALSWLCIWKEWESFIINVIIITQTWRDIWC